MSDREYSMTERIVGATLGCIALLALGHCDAPKTSTAPYDPGVEVAPSKPKELRDEDDCHVLAAIYGARSREAYVAAYLQCQELRKAGLLP